MTLRSYLFAIASAVAILVVVVQMLRKGRLRERHAMWWLLAGILALAAGVFPSTVTQIAALLGIQVPLNLVLFTSITILFVVSLQHAAELTALESKTRALAERVALLEMERQAGTEADTADGSTPPAP